MRVAAVQLNSTAEPAANLAVADRLTRAAAADGARLIVLPEKWTAIGTDEQLRAAAETLAAAVLAVSAIYIALNETFANWQALWLCVGAIGVALILLRARDAQG